MNLEYFNSGQQIEFFIAENIIKYKLDDSNGALILSTPNYDFSGQNIVNTGY